MRSETDNTRRTGPRGRDGENIRFTPEAIRDSLAVVLTLATGATDAIGFLRLGGVFTSVMTANMVLLGISVGRHDGALALHTGSAFAGFVIGGFLGSRIAGAPQRGQRVWPRSVSLALGAELAVFTVFTVWWEVAGAKPSGHVAYVLLAVNAVALGIQSGAVLRLGVTGLSTTYLTGTLTQLLGHLSNRVAPSPRSVGVLVALVTGGILGAVLVIEAPRVAPAAPDGVLVIVLAAAALTFGRRDPRALTGAERHEVEGH